MKNKKIVFIVVGVLFMIFIIFLYVSTRGSSDSENIAIDSATGKTQKSINSDATPTPTITSKQSLGALIVDNASNSQVVEKVGRPTYVDTNNGATVLHYQFGSQENKVLLINGKAVYTVEAISSNKSIAYLDYLASHNAPDGIIYNFEHNDEGYNLYVFSRDGIAFLAHESTGNTTEIHRFSPIKYDDYFTFFGPKISTN